MLDQRLKTYIILCDLALSLDTCLIKDLKHTYYVYFTIPGCILDQKLWESRLAFDFLLAYQIDVLKFIGFDIGSYTL